ncbi:nicotinamidase-related amidase [Pseudodesulfovibrio indicus]|uniref:Nicotinamidase-related amidase n=1 Tax=Pseudodesulfovibrio indicus TaxID=1716143 RepID=A0AA94TIQ9_9BACT|nr:cysteine hydrolase family protein [Pseudodesulfovibrio indicus]TDT82695.1 nicotinamidase-related amidase [Pseudodesulfovibrio indicus]
MSASVLVVVDVQNVMFETPGEFPFEGERVLETIAALIASAREAGVPVHYVQHTTREEGSCCEAGTRNWEIHSSIAPKPGDTVSRKYSYDAFWDTGLEETLRGLGAGRLVFCGLQTEFCVDTTVRSALAHGFESVLVGDAHTTFDTEVLRGEQIVAHHNMTLGGRFCEIVMAGDVEF